MSPSGLTAVGTPVWTVHESSGAAHAGRLVAAIAVRVTKRTAGRFQRLNLLFVPADKILARGQLAFVLVVNYAA